MRESNFYTRGWFVGACFVLTLLISSTTFIRYNISTQKQAIIISDTAAIQTAPGENKTVIYEAKSGLEVELIGFDGDYAQVRYPGAFSGWVLKKQVEILAL